MVNVVCRNYNDDRVLPRFARYLRDHLGWTLTTAPDSAADAVYLMGYFETQMCKTWPDVPVACYFTHREEEPPGNAKARLFDQVAGRSDLRIAMCKMYAELLSHHGPTVQPPVPVERDRFTLSTRVLKPSRMVCGLSGYTYRNQRKGEDLVDSILSSKAGRACEWRASGRGWPVPTQRYTWDEMSEFYKSLDILVCTSRVEGGPMPPLEALSCGVSVVVPRGVGILDELPDILGVHRYTRGITADLVSALENAIAARHEVDREALRAVTEPYTVDTFCAENARAVDDMLNSNLAGIEDDRPARLVEVDGSEPAQPKPAGTNSTRGIYVVAFGDPARKCAKRLIGSIKTHMPEIPICLCAARAIGGEDVLVIQPDSDIGGRRAKLRAYELTPAEWQSVLYLDADTVVCDNIRFYFELIEDGWEFVICKDPHLMDTMHSFRRKTNVSELEVTEREIFTLHTLQYNGGVWAFGRNDRIARFFARWLREWEIYAQRDQGALVRAMYSEPLKVYLLGNEWNTFEKYSKGIATAGLMHYPGDARRWRGQIPGRIDSDVAWARVREFEQMTGAKDGR